MIRSQCLSKAPAGVTAAKNPPGLTPKSLDTSLDVQTALPFPLPQAVKREAGNTISTAA